MSAMIPEMTFESAKIKFGHDREVCQIDRWTRAIIPTEQATETVVLLSATLEFRGLTQGFDVIGTIHQKNFSASHLSAKVRAALVEGLPKRVVYTFFSVAELTVKTESPELEASEAATKLDCIIAPTLEEQAKAGNEATKYWKQALREMQDGLRDGYGYNRGKIQDGLMFLERCHRAANNGIMEGWCEEKLAYIRSGLADLSRRKNPNHPGFTSTASSICGWLQSCPVVNSWHEVPPRLPTKPV